MRVLHARSNLPVRLTAYARRMNRTSEMIRIGLRILPRRS
ncbi:MAG: hypothetical protein V7640_3909 [Betaproteobacteria bacterium]